MRNSARIAGTIFTIVMMIIGIVIFSGCLKQEEEDGPRPWEGIRPPQEVIIDFYSTNGDYELPADNESTLELEAQVMDGEGNPWVGFTVEFSCTLGTVTPPSDYTNSEGIASTVFTAGCIPGKAKITAYTIGRVASIDVYLKGNGPLLTVTIPDETIVGTGTYNPVPISIELECDGVAQTEFAIELWSEYGCFEGGCYDHIRTFSGVVATYWYPPFYFEEENYYDDYNEPLSSVITVTLLDKNDEPTEYSSIGEVYIYPLHMKNLLGDDSLFQRRFCFNYFMYYFDANGSYPVNNIPLHYSLETSKGTEAWFERTPIDSGKICIQWEGESGWIIVTIELRYTGPGNCCADDPDDISIIRSFTITYDENGASWTMN